METNSPYQEILKRFKETYATFQWNDLLKKKIVIGYINLRNKITDDGFCLLNYQIYIEKEGLEET